jgi:hypothetical protein
VPSELPIPEALAAASILVDWVLDLDPRNALEPPPSVEKIRGLLIAAEAIVQEDHLAGVLPETLRNARAGLAQRFAERRRNARLLQRGYRQAQKARLRKVRRATAPRAAYSFAARARGARRRRRMLVQRGRAGRSRKRSRAASSEAPTDGDAGGRGPAYGPRGEAAI